MENQKHKIAIGFILYNADADLALRIDNLLLDGYCVYIFDNTPDNDFFCKKFEASENVVYITLGKNVGLGIGFAAINAMALKDNFEALLFFDQDTVFDNSTITFISDFYDLNKDKLKNYTAVTFNDKNLSNLKNESEKFSFKDAELTISSGSLFLLEQTKKINYHDHTFFVDCVDYEFCFNTYNNNMKNGLCENTPGYDHTVGQADEEYSFLGKKFRSRAYPTFRVKDTLKGYRRLILRSLWSGNFKYFFIFLRSAAIYSFFQILVRILNIFR